MRFIRAVSALTLCALSLAGCAVVTPGMSRDEVLASYGKPSAVVPLADGVRLQYSHQPEGRSVVNVDLDSANKVASVREALTPAEFATVQLGQWTRTDVEHKFGAPAKIVHAYSWQGDIMSYNWRDVSQDMYFWVYLDSNHVVQRTGQGMQFPMHLYRDR